MSKKKVPNIIDDCKKYLGLPPYNDSTNICLHDSYHLDRMYKEYGEKEVQAILYLFRGQVREVNPDV